MHILYTIVKDVISTTVGVEMLTLEITNTAKGTQMEILVPASLLYPQNIGQRFILVDSKFISI